MRSFCFNRILAGVVASLLTITFFYACTKNANDAAPTNEPDNQAITAASYQAAVSVIYDDFFGVALELGGQAALNETGRKANQDKLAAKLGGCLNYELDDRNVDSWPKTMLVDFKTGCADATGRVRAGTLQIIFSGYFYYPGSVIVVKPLTYTVNGVSVSGSATITNISVGNTARYTAVVTGGALKLDTVSLSYSSNYTLTRTGGELTTSDVSDDIFSIYGTDSLVLSTGIKASTVVKETEPVERAIECAWIGKGKSLVTVNGQTATVNFGNGICDDSATVDLGDKVKSIKLPQ